MLPAFWGGGYARDLRIFSISFTGLLTKRHFRRRGGSFAFLDFKHICIAGRLLKSPKGKVMKGESTYSKYGIVDPGSPVFSRKLCGFISEQFCHSIDRHPIGVANQYSFLLKKAFHLLTIKHLFFSFLLCGPVLLSCPG
ncbi:hypothetical protein HMPREF0262_00295 [Clostridium sp. ATCC 29733]|nr:hypothetical protein HMPREF0262_00295 [Clostridium sp. ATCC 29733]